ncbi:hypothetical protein ABFX02_03G034200 [Erythranthe guttata]
MFGTVSDSMEVKVPASEAWKLYGTLELAKIVPEALPNMVSKIDVVQGEGGVGTILELFFLPGRKDMTSYKEKCTVVDDEKRVKETEVLEGGFLDLGFNLYRVRYEVIEKEENVCVTRVTIEYEVREEFTANVALVSIQPIVVIMEAVARHLTRNNPN